MLFVAALCIAAQFSINKLYQKTCADGLKNMLLFPFVSGVFSVALFALLGFWLYGKPPEFSWFSLAMSVALSVVSTLSALVGLVIMKYGNLSVYSVFMMLGGMIMPYFFGLFFLGETISLSRVAGIAILVCALPFSVASPAQGKKAAPAKFYYMLCIAIFLLNGSVSIISKAHSISVSAVPAANFIVYANICNALINGAAYFMVAPRRPGEAEKREAKPNKARAVLTIAICAAVGGVGYLLQLISAETVPAVAMYPFITGGSIVLSAVAARIFFKEKIGKMAAAGIAMSIVGVLLCRK